MAKPILHPRRPQPGTGTEVLPSKPLLFGPAKKPSQTTSIKAPRQAKHQYLLAYKKQYLGTTQQANESTTTGELPVHKLINNKPISNLVVTDNHAPLWKSQLKTLTELRLTKFGRPDKDHSVTQEACAETILFFIIKSGYLDIQATNALYNTNPLIPHMARMIDTLSHYDFRWIQQTDTNWATQSSLSASRRKAMMACLFHYNLDVSLLMRYLGGNYTGAHRRVQETATILRQHKISKTLIQHYIRVMTVGCPNILNANITRENALKYWRAGNNPSVSKKLPQVMKTMNKEDRNKFVIALSSWSWRYIPHLFITPQHILEKPGKKDRQIFDAAFMHDADSIPINMMTEDANVTELHCEFGTVKQRLYTRIYNLRITYPWLDIILHANDVKSCFRQLKHHPDVMGAFSYIINDLLFLQCGLTFGSDFSPASWEVLRRIIELLSESLFEDTTLRTRHRTHLDRLTWQRSLGSTKARFTVAKPDTINTGVLDSTGNAVNTPHDLFVDDDVYADVYDNARARMEQAGAASIEAMFILLGPSDLLGRQDPISFDKFDEMPMDWQNRILGVDIHTRKLAVRTPVEYVAATVHILENIWHKGNNTKHTFALPEAETMAGRLGYISETSPWLRFLMSCMYTSMAHALKASRAHLITTNRDFRNLLKLVKKNLKFPTTNAAHTSQYGKPTQHNEEQRHQAHATSTAAKKVHHTSKRFPVNPTLRREIKLIYAALSSDWINMWRPIGHLIPRDPSGEGWSDSCLHAAGGYSLDLGFWWYYEWPESIKKCTLKFMFNNNDGTLVSINALEYASLIINYVAATYVLTQIWPSPDDPHPVVLLYADNRTAESWLIKASKSSPGGRALGYIQAALMINNPVGINVAHVTSKDNEIADRISRIISETMLLTEMQKIYKNYPRLRSCQRFIPSAELTSLILDTLSEKKFVDPLPRSRRILAAPGKITT